MRRGTRRHHALAIVRVEVAVDGDDRTLAKRLFDGGKQGRGRRFGVARTARRRDHRHEPLRVLAEPLGLERALPLLHSRVRTREQPAEVLVARMVFDEQRYDG